MTLYSPKYCNCLVWALYMCLRHGGNIRSIKSLYGWWPHYIYVRGNEEYEYVPIKPSDNLISPPPLFRGCARKRIDI
jgi:hypothetical protein